MKIKYVGSRPSVSMCCTGRKTYYFGAENGKTVDVMDAHHASQILSSEQHAFQVIVDSGRPAVADTPAPAPLPKVEKPVLKPIQKKGKK